MNKYQNGKIYQITSKQTDDVYIGSTIYELDFRMKNHKNCLNTSSKHIVKYDDAIIELIEEYPCETKDELLWRERYWIENMKCVNKQRPIVTKEELVNMRKINKQKIEYKQQQKQYRELNREHSKEYHIKYNAINSVDISIKKQDYYIKKKQDINKRNNMWYERNKEKRSNQLKAYGFFTRSEFGKLCKMF